MALLFVQQLSDENQFSGQVTDQDVELLLVTALLHDIAHWPFCHPIEDINLPGIVHHEHLAEKHLASDEISKALSQDWDFDYHKVLNLLTKKELTPAAQILSSILSGPIDVDKMDYLYRDSLHAGVPYGRHFDSSRLIGSLCMNEAGTGIAITSKGKTAAELMVFARYVMFSEIYWHHAVRSATAIFQRAFYQLQDQLNKVDLSALFDCTERQIADVMKVLDTENKANELLNCIFGPSRQLYKRWAEFSFQEHIELHSQIARKPYHQLVEISESLSQRISVETGIPVDPNHILIDAPPMGLEVQFDVEVHDLSSNMFTKLANLSPVVTALASRQFDDYVKKVRLFVHPALFPRLKGLSGIEMLKNCVA